MATPTVFSYTLEDENGIKATWASYAEYDGSVETEDGLAGEWVALGALIDAATSAQIIGGHVKIPYSPDGGWKASPAAGSRVEQTGNFTFSNDTTDREYTQALPAIINAAIVNGRIVLTNTHIAALTAALVAGFTNGNWDNNAGQALVALIAASLSFRKRGRQLKEKSTEPG